MSRSTQHLAVTTSCKNPAPKVSSAKIRHLNQWNARCIGSVHRPVSVSLPVGGVERLSSSCSHLSPYQQSALILIGSLLWSSRKRLKDGSHVMCLVRAAARHFLDKVGSCYNPATFVAQVWGCKQATKGSNVLGKVANTWFLPDWCDGSEKVVEVLLTPLQLRNWNRRGAILQECLDAANPHAALVRKTLMVTTEGPAFASQLERLEKGGERKAVKNYRKKPHQLNVTRDVDVQSNVSRLPEKMREALLIDGHHVGEFDVKSAHAVLLGMFYEGETSAEWMAEKARFETEVINGFLTIYGEGNKKRKRKFLSALNQPNTAAIHASEGYREFRRLFPLLARKVEHMKRFDSKLAGRRLRCALAEIMKQVTLDNNADGIHSIPVVDSVVVPMPSGIAEQPSSIVEQFGDNTLIVPMPCGFAEQHRNAFRTAWRLGVPIAKLTGTAPLIVGSETEKYRFFM